MVMVTILITIFLLALLGFELGCTFIPVEGESRSYFDFSLPPEFKKFGRWFLVGLVFIFIIIGIISSIYVTNEQQIGFISTFGHNTIIEGAGIHFKVPFFAKKVIYDGTTKGMPIGYTEESNESVYEDSLMITSDFNFVNIDFYLEYRISDPIEYHYSTNDPRGILFNIAQASIRNTVGQYTIDSVMTTGKSQIEIDVFNDIKKELEFHNLGITVTNVTIQDAETPTAEVQAAFKAVEAAKQNAETAVNEANTYTNSQLPAAEGTAVEVLQKAQAIQTERINSAKEEVAKFNALYSEYVQNPEIVKERIYLEAISSTLSKLQIIIGNDAKVIYVSNDGLSVTE